MRQSQLFAKTKKQSPKNAKIISHKFLIRGDFIDQLASGIYSFLPLGWRVHKKIEQIIREEMEAIGGQEVFLPVCQPKFLWEETNRWKTFEPPLFIIKDRHKKEFALGPTHEEVITDLVRKRVESYKDLPLYLFQIQNKFRNEMRSTGGLLRVREFIMKDLYSFHVSEKDLANYYKKVEKAYFKIFKRCQLKAVPMEAESGAIGGSISHEFAIINESGESKILICDNCGLAISFEKMKQGKKCPKCGKKMEVKNCIEASHSFNLGTKYTEVMSAYFIDRTGEKKPIIMGCYGIGLGRLMATIIELHHDKNGIIWPKQVAPFDVHLIRIGDNKKVKAEAEKVYNALQKKQIEILYDDRKDTPGIKFADADLIGIPLRIVISEKTLKRESVEFKKRNEKKIKLIKIKDILKNV